ncbi:MAG: hypothetical protein EX269_15100, partial [Acidimicrobiales bacterium]
SPSTTTTSPSAADPAPSNPLDVQGHRGARGLQPENTLPAFEVALDSEVSTLELDLHFTSDGQVVVWHDPTVPTEKCETGDSPDAATLDSAIANLSRAELAGFRCDKNPDAGRFPDQTATPTALAGDNYSIVTLDELFEFVAAYSTSELKTEEQRTNAESVRFNVETKRQPQRPETINDGFDGVNPGPFELAILETITAREVKDRVTIQSFDHRSLRAIRTIEDSISLAALSRRNVPFDAGLADFAQIWSPDYRSLSASGLDKAQAVGMMVIPWTVNDTSDMNRLIDLGVDGLITDRPDLLIQEIASRP